MDNKKPWLKKPEDRQHTKIVTMDNGDGTSSSREVPCTCDVWDEGETHHDFDGI